MDKTLDIFYFSSTHWDREWYQTFQGFRYRLVKLVDNLLTLIESDPDYETFHFDGQTIVLEDYCEISPENKERLKKLIEERKILIGPWYVMPDELLVSGESLIRNLQKGHAISKEWNTEPWKYGYVCDCFGHTPQMPQIFKGFNINYSILGRGTTEDDPTYFKWQSPDGSEVLTYKLHPHTGYGNFKCDVWSKLADNSPSGDEATEKIKWYIDREIERCDVPVIIIMDGNDHSEVFPRTTQYIKRIAELYPQANIHHVNLCEQGKLLEKYAYKLPTIWGELNKTAQLPRPYLHLITNTLSSHYPIKQQNDRCQNILEKQTEPMCALSALDGIDLNHSFVKRAYKYLLQNHPHDSICGCSIDQVHKDMEFRFDQTESICRELKEDYLFQNRKNSDSENYVLTLYNTLPYDIEKTVSVDLEFATGYGHTFAEPFGYENINAFKIYDFENREIPYKLTDIKRNYFKRYCAGKAAMMDIHTVTFTASIPACGSAQYTVKPVDTSVRYFDRLTSGTNYAENDHIRVDIEPNGGISITDKKTKKTYSSLCHIEDNGEIGDGWYHASPVNDIFVNTSGSACNIEKIENGPSRCVFRVTRNMEIPKQLTKDGVSQYRSDEKTTVRIISEIGLSKENRFADIKMTIDNTAKDHRMKLLLPTGINSEKYFSGQAFCCVERNAGIDASTCDWHESDQYEKATNGIFGRRNEKGEGLAFVSAEGLHECSVYDDNDGTMAVTLLRAFHKTPQTMGEEKCQLQKELCYSFAIAPIDSLVQYCDLLKIQDSLAIGPMSMFEKGNGANAPESKLSVSGKDIVTSIIKAPENGEKNTIVVRVFNASGRKSEGKIELCKDIKRAEETNLNEETIASIKANGNSVSFDIDAWKIKTFKIYY